MFEIIQEAVLPKLSQTSFYGVFEKNSQISKHIRDAVNNASKYMVKPDALEEIIALMKLNGDAIVKKAILAYQKGDIVIIYNKETSKIPLVLPYICIGKGNVVRAYIFADKVVNNIKATGEYTNLMAVLEAAYLSLCIHKNPNKFLNNRQLMLILCNIYCDMVSLPLEQKMYIKGENLTKLRLYAMAYFYKIIDGNSISIGTIPYKRIIQDKIDERVVKQIIESVKNDKDMGFMSLLKKISTINPVRYKNIEAMYLNYFTSTCGVTLIFAIENPTYLMLLLTSASYKTTLSAFGLNKLVGVNSRQALKFLMSYDIK